MNTKRIIWIISGVTVIIAVIIFLVWAYWSSPLVPRKVPMGQWFVCQTDQDCLCVGEKDFPGCVNGICINGKCGWRSDTSGETSTTTVQNSAANWQTYRNEEHGFEMLHPPTYRIESESADSILFVAFPQSFELHILKKADIAAEIRNLDYPIKSVEEIVVGGQSGKFVVEDTADCDDCAYRKTAFIQYGFNVIELSGNASETNIRKILSTFKFIEPVDTSTWQTYRNEQYGFEVKYPPSLMPSGWSGQTYLIKKEASDAERMDYSDQLVEIRVDKASYRFDKYSNTTDGSIVEGFGDLKIRNYTIDGYKAVEYGYDEALREKEIEEQRKALESGASVGIIYFPKGLIINKDGTIIEISTGSYFGDFSDTFDQILSTFKFIPPTSEVPQAVFTSPEECEIATGKQCSFVMCDYVPPGKTFDEVCGKDFQPGWAPRSAPSETTNLSSPMLRIVWSGGLCPSNDGGGQECTSKFLLRSDGSYISGQNQGMVSNEDMNRLRLLIEGADFASIKSKKLIGTCARSYDGSSPTYTFYINGREEIIDSCDIEIDASSPLFSEINRITGSIFNQL